MRRNCFCYLIYYLCKGSIYICIMNEPNTIFIGRESCGDCFRCVRECAVRAVRISNSRAEIIDSMCVGCGECVTACPAGVIKVRDDVWLTRRCIKNHEIKVASLSPSWVSEFPGIEPRRMVEALKLMGFTHVSESSFGAEVILQHELDYMRNNGGIHISSRCPAMVDYIRKYRPKLADRILPFQSPMLVHAQLIKQWWGDEARVVHISACAAAKGEAAQSDGLVDIALTFRELKQWMYDEGIEFEKIPGLGSYRFEPCNSRREGLLYPLERGALSDELLRSSHLDSIKIITKSGLTQVDKYLYHTPQNLTGETVYLNLMACGDGCLHTAGSVPSQKPAFDREVLLLNEYEKRKTEVYILPDVNIKTAKVEEEPVGFVAETETIAALNSIGIYTERDQLNCNGCGYVTCRRFAKALSKGNVEPYMCTPYLRREFKDKFTMLLQRMPSGILVVNDKLQVVEANRNFAAMLGADVELMFDANPGMAGTDIRTIVPFHKLFVSALESGEGDLDRDVQIKEHMMKVSIYTIQKHKLVMAIARNLFISQVRNEEIIKRTQQVIRDNMETVQRIASLLGENASRTEAILNSILDSQSVADVEQG